MLGQEGDGAVIGQIEPQCVATTVLVAGRSAEATVRVVGGTSITGEAFTVDTNPLRAHQAQPVIIFPVKDPSKHPLPGQGRQEAFGGPSEPLPDFVVVRQAPPDTLTVSPQVLPCQGMFLFVGKEPGGL